jgi:hypothetical protein
MNRHSRSPRTRSYRSGRAMPRTLGLRLVARELLAGAAAAAVLSIVAATVLVSQPGPSPRAVLESYVDSNAQTLTVSDVATRASITRDTFTATAGYATLAAGGTNYDWAKLVMLYAGWPMSDENITVFTRWMRQENGTDDWWNRNNPLNNGWGSGGGGGTGTYDDLDLAAQNAAEALHENPGYAAIAAAFAASSPTAVTEQAIWASPWATSHYANGAHWSQVVVPTVTSPSGTW